LIVFCTWTRIALVSAAANKFPEDQVRINPSARAIGVICFNLVFIAAVSTASAQKHLPSNGSGAFATGHYRNLFREAGHSQPQIDAKINAAFDQLFHGDPNTQAVYYSTGKNADGPIAYITDVAHHDVRTEGMSYGMMISVQLNKKAEFDALWNWAETYMYISDPKHPYVRIFFVVVQTQRHAE
jgi:oligosaccharide reducing-end xylanase